MTTNIVLSLKAEIADLRAQIAADPRHKKLALAEQMLSLYLASGDASEARSRKPNAWAADAGSKKSDSTRAILKEIDLFFDTCAGTPVLLGAIFDDLSRKGIIIPGTKPRNNLSAILSNSGMFVSLGKGSGWIRAPQQNEAAGAPTPAASNPARGDFPGNPSPNGAFAHAERS